MNFNKIGNPAINALNESEEENKKQTSEEMQSSEEMPSSEEKTVLEDNSNKNLLVENNFSIFNIFQIILFIIILSIVLVVILLSGSIAVSGWSINEDPGTIAKFIIFIFGSFFWFLYLPYYYIYVVWFKGTYYTSNIYPLPSWLG